MDVGQGQFQEKFFRGESDGRGHCRTADGGWRMDGCFYFFLEPPDRNKQTKKKKENRKRRKLEAKKERHKETNKQKLKETLKERINQTVYAQRETR